MAETVRDLMRSEYRLQFGRDASNDELDLMVLAATIERLECVDVVERMVSNDWIRIRIADAIRERAKP